MNHPSRTCPRCSCSLPGNEHICACIGKYPLSNPRVSLFEIISILSLGLIGDLFIILCFSSASIKNPPMWVCVILSLCCFLAIYRIIIGIEIRGHYLKLIKEVERKNQGKSSQGQ